MCYGAYKGLELADILNRLFFGLPSDVALQEAYENFGVSCNATTAQVNSAYRKFCLKHHPDKGADGEMFLKGQFYMEIIRADRMAKE
jgi:DnaJ-class molecular chaperone with C-terminal Zn finger domain